MPTLSGSRRSSIQSDMKAGLRKMCLTNHSRLCLSGKAEDFALLQAWLLFPHTEMQSLNHLKRSVSRACWRNAMIMEWGHVGWVHVFATWTGTKWALFLTSTKHWTNKYYFKNQRQQILKMKKQFNPRVQPFSQAMTEVLQTRYASHLLGKSDRTSKNSIGWEQWGLHIHWQTILRILL